MTRLSKTIKSISSKMITDFDYITKEIKHKGLRGGERELIVEEFLKKYVPKQFGIGKGEIISVYDEVSKEQDIVIYDKIRCPLLYDSNNIQVFPAEGVYCVIQVKSYLDSDQLKDCIENIKSVKKLPKEAFISDENQVIQWSVTEHGRTKKYYDTIGIVFAYESISLKTLRKEFENLNKDVLPEHRINFICVLKKGMIFNLDIEKKMIVVVNNEKSKLAHSESDDGLLIFYLLLMERLSSILFALPIDAKRYASTLIEFDDSD